MKKRNKGFSLVELLLAVALLSIVMLMVTQFMGSTSAAYRKTTNNIKVQTEANEVMGNISDTLEKANFIRVSVADPQAYVIKDTSSGTTRKREITASSDSLTSDKGATVSYDFVSDNYGNYIRPAKDINGNATSERKVIIDFDTYKLVGEKKNTYYPLKDDLDTPGKTETVTLPISGTDLTVGGDIRSFRALQTEVDTDGDGTADTSRTCYVKPRFIYAETQNATDNSKVDCSIYLIEDDTVFLYKETRAKISKDRFTSMCNMVCSYNPTASKQGILTEGIEDFYLSADVDGNAVMLNVMFKDNKYEFNSIETVKLRNSNVLTVRPQSLYKVSKTTP